MEDEPAQEAIADESPGEFDSTGTVVLGEHIVPVYVSQTRQCEWGLLDVLRVFTRSTSKSKRFEAFKNAWDKIVSCHSSLWPGLVWWRSLHTAAPTPRRCFLTKWQRGKGW